MPREKKPSFEGKMRIKKGDMVQVIAGKDKGRQGKVLQVLPDEGKVIVEGVNVSIRHTKAQPTQANPNPPSGRVEKHIPLAASKVMLVNADGQPTRVRIQTNPDGSKARVAVKGGRPIPEPA